MKTGIRKAKKIQQVIGSMQKNFECPICLDLMKNPVSTKCDHKFCRHCLLETIGKRTTAPCPLCKIPFTKRSLQPLETWNQLMKAMAALVEAFQVDSGAQFSPSHDPLLSSGSGTSQHSRQPAAGPSHEETTSPSIEQVKDDDGGEQGMCLAAEGGKTRSAPSGLDEQDDCPVFIEDDESSEAVSIPATTFTSHTNMRPTFPSGKAKGKQGKGSKDSTSRSSEQENTVRTRSRSAERGHDINNVKNNLKNRRVENKDGHLSAIYRHEENDNTDKGEEVRRRKIRRMRSKGQKSEEHMAQLLQCLEDGPLREETQGKLESQLEKNSQEGTQSQIHPEKRKQGRAAESQSEPVVVLDRCVVESLFKKSKEQDKSSDLLCLIEKVKQNDEEATIKSVPPTTRQMGEHVKHIKLRKVDDQILASRIGEECDIKISKEVKDKGEKESKAFEPVTDQLRVEIEGDPENDINISKGVKDKAHRENETYEPKVNKERVEIEGDPECPSQAQHKVSRWLQDMRTPSSVSSLSTLQPLPSQPASHDTSVTGCKLQSVVDYGHWVEEEVEKEEGQGDFIRRKRKSVKIVEDEEKDRDEEAGRKEGKDDEVKTYAEHADENANNDKNTNLDSLIDEEQEDDKEREKEDKIRGSLEDMTPPNTQKRKILGDIVLFDDEPNTPPGRKKSRFFKTRKNKDFHVKQKRSLIGSPSEDPYAFKSSQKTPKQKGKKRKQARREMTVFEEIEEESDWTKNNNKRNFDKSKTYSKKKTDGTQKKKRIQSNQKETKEGKSADKLKNKKEEEEKRVSESDAEMQSLVEKISQAEDFDLMFSQQVRDMQAEARQQHAANNAENDAEIKVMEDNTEMEQTGCEATDSKELRVKCGDGEENNVSEPVLCNDTRQGERKDEDGKEITEKQVDTEKKKQIFLKDFSRRSLPHKQKTLIAKRANTQDPKEDWSVTKQMKKDMPPPKSKALKMIEAIEEGHRQDRLTQKPKKSRKKRNEKVEEDDDEKDDVTIVDVSPSIPTVNKWENQEEVDRIKVLNKGKRKGRSSRERVKGPDGKWLVPRCADSDSDTDPLEMTDEDNSQYEHPNLDLQPLEVKNMLLQHQSNTEEGPNGEDSTALVKKEEIHMINETPEIHSSMRAKDRANIAQSIAMRDDQMGYTEPSDMNTEDMESVIGPTGQTTVRCPDSASVCILAGGLETEDNREAESLRSEENIVSTASHSSRTIRKTFSLGMSPLKPKFQNEENTEEEIKKAADLIGVENFENVAPDVCETTDTGDEVDERLSLSSQVVRIRRVSDGRIIMNKEALDEENPTERDENIVDPHEQTGEESKESKELTGKETMDPNEQTGVETMDPSEQTVVETMDPSEQIGLETMDPNEQTGVETMDPSEQTVVETMDPNEQTEVETMDPSEQIEVETMDPSEQIGLETMDPSEQIGLETMECKEQIGVETLESKEQIGVETMESMEQIGVEIMESKEQIGVETMESKEQIGLETMESKEQIGVETMESKEWIGVETMDVDEKLEAHTLNTDMEKEEGEGEKITIEASSHRNPQNVEESQINIPPSLEHHIDRDGPASVKVSKKGRKRKSSDSSCLPNKKAQTCLKDNSSNKDEISHILTASSHKISSQSTQDPNADIEGEMSGPDMFSAPEDLTDTELQLEQNKKKIASLNVRSPTYQSQRSCEKSVESSQNSVSLLQPRPVYLAQSKDPAIIVDEEESSNEVEEDNNKEKENKNKRTPKTMSRKKAVSGDGEMESEDEDDSKRRRSGVRAIRGLASKINITNVTPERFAALENKGDYDGKGGGVDSDLFKSPQVIQETPRLGDRPRKFSKTINKMERDTETLREDSNFVSPTPPVTKVTSPPQLSTQTRGVTRFSPKQSGSFKVPVTQMCQDEGQDSSPSGTQAMPSTASPHLSRREQIRLEKRKAFEKEEEDLYGDDVILVNMEEEEAVQTEVEEDIRETMASLDKDIFSAESEEEDTANRDVKEDLNGSKYNPVELDSDEDSIPDEEMAEPLIKRSKEIAEIISDEEEEAVKNISSKYEGQDTEEDEEDLHTFRRNRTRKAVISDDEEDEDENSGEDGRVTPHNAVSHNLTSSSAVSSQSDTNTEGRELLAADMEQLQNEIAQLEAQLMQKNDTLSLSNIEGIVADDTRSRSRASSTNSESEGGRVSESDMTRLQNQIAELEAQLQAQNSTIPSKYMELSDDEEDEVCMVEEENISTPCQRIRSSGDRLSKDDQMNTNEQDTRISGVSSKSKRMNNNGGGDINKEGENEVEEIALEENEQEDEEMQENVIEVKGDDEDVEEDKENNEDMQEEVDEEDVEEEANMEEELAEIAAQLKAHNAGMMKRGALSDDEEDLDEHAQHNIHDNDEMNMKEDNQMDTVPDSGEDGGLEGNNNYHQSDNDLFNVASPRSPTPPPSQSALTDDTEAQNVETEQDSELPNVLGQDVLDLQTVDEIPATPEAEETEIPEELRKALEVLEKYKMSPSINIPLVKNVVQKEKKSTPSRKHLADIHLNDREDRKRKGKSSPYSRKQKIERVKGEKTNTATGHHGVSPLLNSEAESQVKVEKTSPKVKVMGELDVSTQRLPPRRTSSIQKRLITPIKASPLSRDASLPLPSGVSPLVASVGTTPLSSRSSASRTSPDLNSEFPSKPHWSFLTSGIGRLSIKRQIEKLARLIGSDVPIPSKFSTRTTHVLLSQHPESDDRLVCQRTLKYFQGIAGSRWVLHYSWVVDSLQAGKLLPEEQYEMQGCNIHTSAQASRKSRLARKPILHHYEVCCHGNFTDLTKEDLHGMIEMSGATLVQDPAMFSFDAHLTQVIIIEDNEDKNLRQLQKVARKYDVPIVGKDWLLDSLSLYQVADISDYSAVEP